MQEEELKSNQSWAKKPQRQRTKKITEKGLNKVALIYLARYSTTAENLRKVLMRRIEISAQNFGTDLNEGAVWVETLLKKYQKFGYLNDRDYAEKLIRTLLAKGKSTRTTVMQLRRKGVNLQDVDAALETVRDDITDIDLYAAIALARRRQLGPYQRPNRRQECRDSDLAILARAGFNYEIAKRIVDSKSQADLEIMLVSDGRDDNFP